MPKEKPIALPSEGGAYVIDSATGLPVLVERTGGPAPAPTPDPLPEPPNKGAAK